MVIEVDFKDYDLLENEFGYDSDLNVYRIYKSKDLTTTGFNTIGRIEVIVNDKMEVLETKLPCFSWGAKYGSITLTELDKFKTLLNKINERWLLR